jgi:glycerophosphoryl diester phosphodiesterase
VRPDNTAFDGQFEIPALGEVVELARRLGVGIYPETKHPAYHRSLGLELEPRLTAALEGAGVPWFVQSFDAASLQKLPRPRVQLIGRGPVDVAAVAEYADAIGPAKALVDTDLINAAHAAGLAVHPYTFRAEPRFLSDGAPDLASELRHYYALGVDGVFADHPDAAVAAR